MRHPPCLHFLPAPSLSAETAAIVQAYQRASKATPTVRAHTSDAVLFRAWCPQFGFRCLPASPEAVDAFLVSEAETGRATSTIGRRCAAIRYAHRLAGQPAPSDNEGVHAAFKGIRLTRGTAPMQKAAASANILAAMLLRTPDAMTGKRDRALLALGFAGAFWRSELIALDVTDLREDKDGLRVLVRRSTDPRESFRQLSPQIWGRIRASLVSDR